MTTAPTFEQIGQEIVEYTAGRPPAIKTQEDYSLGETWLSGLRKKRKSWQAFFDTLLKPHKDAVKQTQATITRLLEPAEDGERDMETKLQTWRAEQRRIADKAETKALEKYHTRVANAEAKGKDPAEVAPPPIFEGPAKSSEVLTWATIKRGYLASDPTANTDTKPKVYAHEPRAKSIPAEYFMLDWVKVGGACRSGIQVPGVVIDTVEKPRDR
jgi:hypothetical protein